MIRLLKGIVELIDYPFLIVDVNGVGYHVYCSNGVLSQSNIGKTIKIFTYTHVREDILELYGFDSMEELQMFENLLGVSGIGPKTAIGVFSIGSKDQIVQAILSDNAAFFLSVPRLGRKNAQKLIIELKNKVSGGAKTSSNGFSNDEVTTALLGLGYSMQEISKALQEVGGDGESVSEKVRLALKSLGSR